MNIKFNAELQKLDDMNEVDQEEAEKMKMFLGTSEGSASQSFI